MPLRCKSIYNLLFCRGNYIIEFRNWQYLVSSPVPPQSGPWPAGQGQALPLPCHDPVPAPNSAIMTGSSWATDRPNRGFVVTYNPSIAVSSDIEERRNTL